MENNKSQKKTDGNLNLTAAFGVKGITLDAKPRRDKSLNIGIFSGEGWNNIGMPLGRLTFNDAAKMIRAESEDDLTEKEIDRMLARQNGVKLRNGKVLKDVWAKGSFIPTKYDE